MSPRPSVVATAGYPSGCPGLFRYLWVFSSDSYRLLIQEGNQSITTGSYKTGRVPGGSFARGVGSAPRDRGRGPSGLRPRFCYSGMQLKVGVMAPLKCLSTGAFHRDGRQRGKKGDPACPKESQWATAIRATLYTPMRCEALFAALKGIAGGGFKSVEEGAKVSYEATRGNKGMQAENVTPV